MTTILTLVLLINSQPYDYVREMPNLDVCKHAMEMLESFNYQSLDCREQSSE
jgi:hypothetical protein